MDACVEFLRPIVQRTPNGVSKISMITLRTDEAKELVSKEAKRKLGEIGVQQSNSAGYHKNGIAKIDRYIRTLGNGMRTIMNDAEAPGREWPAAARYFTRAYNNTPTRGNNDHSPAYEFMGKEPEDTAQWKTFYAPVYVLKQGVEKKGKSWRLEDTSMFGHYLGTPEGQRGHLIRLPGRNVKFAKQVWL